MNYKPKYFDRLPPDGILKRAEYVEPYLFNDNIAIAVDVALATNRPLLVAGKPGCGKSRLAEAVAAVQSWNYLGKTMTSRTRLEELTVENDHLRRLHDAQGPSELKPDEAYHNPGIFWWAFNPDSASSRGLSKPDAKSYKMSLDFPGIRRGEPGRVNPVVLLIDEIDKAEPDLPNDLLEPLDWRSFSLPNGEKIEAHADLKILTIITTNGERELPQAFLRRCVALTLDEPGKSELIEIAAEHYPQANVSRVAAIAKKILLFREQAVNQRKRPPGTSEFLNAVQACEELAVEVDDDQDSIWKKIENAVLIKEIQA